MTVRGPTSCVKAKIEIRESKRETSVISVFYRKKKPTKQKTTNSNNNNKAITPKFWLNTRILERRYLLGCFFLSLFCWGKKTSNLARDFTASRYSAESRNQQYVVPGRQVVLG